MALEGVGPGLAGSLPPLWVRGEPRGAPWLGTCLQLGLPVWRKARGAGLRLVKSRPSCLAQAAHPVQGHSPSLGVWPGQLSRADHHDTKPRYKHQERLFIEAACRHSQGNSTVRLGAEQPKALEADLEGPGLAGPLWVSVGWREPRGTWALNSSFICSAEV